MNDLKSKKKLFSYLLLIIFLFVVDATAQKSKDSLKYYARQLRHIDELPLDTVLFIFDKAVFFAGDTLKANLLRKEGNYLFGKNLKESGARYYQKALRLAQDKNIKTVEARVYHDLGYSYYMVNDYYSAYKYFLKAKKIYAEINDLENLNIINTNLGTFLEEEGRFAEAKKIYEESLKYYQNKQDSLEIANVLINIGNLKAYTDGREEAIAVFKELENNRFLDAEGLSLVNYNLAINYMELDDAKNAKIYIDKAIKISDSIGDTVQLIDLYKLKADAEVKLGNLSSAERFLHLSLKGAEDIEDFPFQIELYKQLIGISIKSKKIEKIDGFFKEISKIQDTLDSREKINSFKEVFLENELKEKEEEIVLHTNEVLKEKKTKRLYLGLIIFGLLSFSALSLVFYLSKLNYKKNIALASQKAKIKDIEMRNSRKIEAMQVEQIQNDLKAKKRELLITLLFVKKRKEKLKSIGKEIEKVANQSVITKSSVLSLDDFVKEKAKELDNEENVQQKLVNTHKDFFDKLLAEYPELSKTELKILAYLRVGLSTKEIADVQYVSIDAIRKSRYRIRKKLNLDSKESLEKFILKFH
jgi:DNA-binding CsgD family transcriptional regulator/Tfp pilus assembly protein PilF